MTWEKDRPLRSEEREVWKRVARTVAPRRYPKGKGSAKPLPSREDFANMLRIAPNTSVERTRKPQSLDINNDKKTRRGRVEIDAKIDLHDMTQDEAPYAQAHIKHGGAGAWYVFLKK